MTSELIGVPPHPVAAFAERLNTRLDDVGQMGLTTMSPAEKREALVALAVARAKADALYLRLLAEADASQVCLGAGAVDASGFVAAETHQTRREARSDLKLAKRLETMPVLAAGITDGGVNTAQARVIVHAVDSLPTSGEFAVSAEQRLQAEQHLVAEAARFDAVRLAILGREIFEVICPELAEAYEGKKIEAEEAQAARKTTFSMWEDDQGVAHGRFRIPARHAAMLRKAIQSLTNPVRHDTTRGSGIDTDLPQAVREGIALTQVIEAINSHWLPSSGGVGATVVVTMTLEQLLADLDRAGVCTLDTGGRISACRGPAPRLPGRDHPGRTRWKVSGARRRHQVPLSHRTHAHRHGCARPWLHGRGLRRPRLDVSRPPRHRLQRRWSDQRRERPVVVRASPPAYPRPQLRPRQAAHRQGQVPPPDVSERRFGTPRRAGPAGNPDAPSQRTHITDERTGWSGSLSWG